MLATFNKGTFHKALGVIEKKGKLRLATFNKGCWMAHAHAMFATAWLRGGGEASRA